MTKWLFLLKIGDIIDWRPATLLEKRWRKHLSENFPNFSKELSCIAHEEKTLCGESLFNKIAGTDSRPTTIQTHGDIIKLPPR